MLFLLLCLMSVAHGQTETRLEELTRRIEQLERQQEELILEASGSRNNVHSFLRDNLTLGGFFESDLTFLGGPDTDFKAMNSTNVLALNISADFTPRLRFVTQALTVLGYPLTNQHNDPSPEPATLPQRREFGAPVFGTLLTQGYLEYVGSDAFQLRAGTGYVPFGYALQQREMVLFIRRAGPQILRTPQLVSPLWNGLHALGSFRAGRGRAGYDVYTTNPADTDSDSDVLGGGARGWWSSAGEKVTAGLSGQVGKFSGQTSEVVGADLRWRSRHWVITSEYAQRVMDREDPWSAYLEVGRYFARDRWLVYAFGDYARSTLPEDGPGADFYRKWEYGVGLNWLPTSYTRIRIGPVIHDYVGGEAVEDGQNRDYVSLDLSVGVAF